MNIEAYGTGERMRFVADMARALNAQHLVLLPVPTTKDKKHITNTDLSIWQTLTGVGRGSKVYGYGLPEEYRRSIESLGGKWIDLSEDEEYLKENAVITAIGAVGYLLTSSVTTPDAMRIGIVGYGRIGSELVRLLLFLGAQVRVYTSKLTTCLELWKCGVECILTPQKGGGVWNFEGLDILMNTAPRSMTEAFGENASKDMRILELASGENFDGIDGVERLPALPDKMYPKRAAEAYISATRRHL